MGRYLNILIVEDFESDALLLQHYLKKGGFDVSCEVIETPEAMKATLTGEKQWDVITSDHAMPRFSAPESLAMAKELCPDIPFIILSGEIDINLAVSLMKGGAWDYVQKKEMALIVPAIEHALAEVELRETQKKTSQALDESESRFKEVLENSLVASYKRNLLTSTYEYFSPVITKISGYTPEEMNTLDMEKILALFHPDDLAETNRRLGDSLSGKNNPAVSLEYRFKHKNGHYVWLEDKYAVIREDRGTPVALIGSVIDVTDRKKMEEALRESKAKYKRLHENAGVGIGYYSTDGVVISYNQLAAQHMGGKPEDFTGRSVFELFPKEGAEVYFDRIQKAVRSETNHVYEDKVDLPGGDKYFLSTFTRMLDAQGLVEGVQIISSDISELKNAQAELNSAKLRLESILEGTQAGTWEWNVQTGETIFNEKWAEIIGYTLAELEPVSIETWKAVAHPEDFEESGKRLSEHFARITPFYDLECRVKHKDGHWVWVHDRGRVLTWTEDGKPLMMYGTHIQVSQARHFE